MHHKFFSLAFVVLAASFVGCDRLVPDSREPSTGPVIEVGGDDAEMNEAMEKARTTFASAWEEYRDGGDPANDEGAEFMVKAYFVDEEEDAEGEHMWVGGLSYDGETISGTLLSEPRDLRSVALHDAVAFPLDRLSDWMWVREGVATGAWTVQLLRSRMSAGERREHDSHYPFRFPD